MTEPGKTLDFIVLIPYYNDPSGLKSAISSIHYDPEEFGILVVDDGSEEEISLTQLQSYSPTPNLHLIRSASNKGITHTLNAGLEFLYKSIRFRYIARLDCGDICVPERFKVQVSWLDKHPEMLMAGSWCSFFDSEKDKIYLYKTPVSTIGIMFGMHFRNLFIHPTMMWRQEVKELLTDYPTEFPCAEDYAWAFSIMKKGKVAVIPKILVNCKLNVNGLSISRRKQQLISRSQVVDHLGGPWLLRKLGVIKMKLMMKVPYQWILNFKNLFYGKQQSFNN
jgi:glycosyltransferase involved in cell wall biosynthesis